MRIPCVKPQRSPLLLHHWGYRWRDCPFRPDSVGKTYTGDSHFLLDLIGLIGCGVMACLIAGRPVCRWIHFTLAVVLLTNLPWSSVMSASSYRPSRGRPAQPVPPGSTEHIDFTAGKHGRSALGCRSLYRQVDFSIVFYSTAENICRPKNR